MNVTQKVRIKIQHINVDIFSNQILLKSIDNLNRNNDVKQFKIRKYYIPKGIIANYNVIINGKKIMSKLLIQI